MSLPIEPNHIAFDEFLFVFGLCENTSHHIEDKYILCKKVDQRLIEFLRYIFIDLDFSTTIARNQKHNTTISKPKSLNLKSKRSDKDN